MAIQDTSHDREIVSSFLSHSTTVAKSHYMAGAQTAQLKKSLAGYVATRRIHETRMAAGPSSAPQFHPVS
jgi:hypothetical protein